MKNTLIIQNTCERVIIPLILFAISYPGLRAQSPLDQPSQKKITVGSEIERGRREMDVASNASRTVNVVRAASDLNRVLDRNRSRNTDSDGFLLGASLGMWMNLEILLKIASDRFNSSEDLQLGRRYAVETFAKMRELQKKLGVNDDALLSAAGFKS